MGITMHMKSVHKKKIHRKNMNTMNSKTFQCKDCNQKFGYEANLDRHLKNKGDQLYQCKECDKSFFKCKLNRHGMILVGENPYSPV